MPDGQSTEADKTTETVNNLTSADWWLSIDWMEMGVNVGVWLGIVLVAWIAGGIIAGAVRRGIESSKKQPSAIFKSFVVTWVRRIVLLLGVVVAFGTVDVDVAPIIAGLGVFGFVVGFALQGTLSNFASGIMLLIYQPFDEGDVVEANGVVGKVISLSVVNTTLYTPDNREVILPNSSVWGSTIINITRQPTRRVDMTIGVGYDANLGEVRQLVIEHVKAHEKVLDDPDVQVEVLEWGDSSVNLVVRPWCKTADYWTVYFDLMRSMKVLLDEKGIEIPFPQRVVHMKSTD